jgi:hypothetical protein
VRVVWVLGWFILLKKFTQKTLFFVDLIQVVHVAMRHIGDLRTIYAFYSRLGTSSADNIYVLSRLQVCWQKQPSVASQSSTFVLILIGCIVSSRPGRFRSSNALSA